MSSVRVKCKVKVSTPRGPSVVTHTVEVPSDIGSEEAARVSARQALAESYHVSIEQVELLSFDVVGRPLPPEPPAVSQAGAEQPTGEQQPPEQQPGKKSK